MDSLYENGVFWWFIGVLSVGFSRGYQSILVLALCHPVAACQLYGIVSNRSTPLAFLAVWSSLTLGYTTAFASSLSTEGFHFSELATVFGIFVVFTSILASCYALNEAYSSRFPDALVARSLVLPCSSIFVWKIVQLSPFGAYIDPGSVFVVSQDIVQITSLFGLPALTFLFYWIGAVTHMRFFKISEAEGKIQEPMKRLFNQMLICLFLIFLYGGARISLGNGQFFQTSVENMFNPSVPGLCLFGDSDPTENLIISTKEACENGQKVVLWSEGAGNTISKTEEDILIARAKTIANENGCIIGMAYTRKIEDSDKLFNTMTIVAPKSQNQDKTWIYHKMHPVPIVENIIKAGDGDLEVLETEIKIGQDYSEEFTRDTTITVRISGSICFDLDFPQVISQAGRKKVTLFLQPSYTWGPIYRTHALGDAIRAVENGFTLFRCSARGISGVFDPYFDTRSLIPSLVKGKQYFSIPLKSSTAFVLFPFTFDILSWILTVLAAIFAIVILLDKSSRLEVLPQVVVKFFIGDSSRNSEQLIS